MDPIQPIQPHAAAPNPHGPPALINAYAHRQALEDGMLVDVTQAAHEAGFTWPLALTAEVWALIAAIPAAHVCEDCGRRLWDVLLCARAQAMAAPPQETQIHFGVILHHAQGDFLQLKLVAGPGDQGEPVFTIMLPEQD